MIQKLYKINHQIQASQVRLLAADGTQIAVLSIDDARAKAIASKLDLVEISASADPPVVKLINFKKFKYQEAKKEREAVKKVKKVDLKEIWLKPFMADNDLKMRLDRIQEFLIEGNKVRLVVRFTGRQMSHAEFGYEILKKVFDTFKESSSIDQPPKMIGRQIICVLSPTRK